MTDRSRVLKFMDFLAKLGIKSAKRNLPPYITGKHVQFYLNGVKLKCAEGVDYVLDDNPGDLTLFGPKR